MRFSPSPLSPPAADRGAAPDAGSAEAHAFGSNGASSESDPETPVSVEGARRQPSIDIEHLVWFAVIALAAAIRLPSLSSLPLTVADSSRAFSAWQVAGGRLPATWNGDAGQTLVALMFKLFGSSDGLARLPAAVAATALVGALWFFRPFVGRVPALIAAVAICLSPVCVAIARSMSPYAAGALFSVCIAVLVLEFLRDPRPAPFLWICGLVALGLSSDAGFLVFLIGLVFFVLVEGLIEHRAALHDAYAYLRSDTPLLRSSALIALAGLLLSLTKFGIASERLRSAAMISWSNAFDLVNGAPPWHYPLDAFLGYEPLLALGGLACAVLLILRLRRDGGTDAERVLLYWAAAELVFVLVASNKSAGQLPALLVPLALIAGSSCTRWLATARADLLRLALLPVVLAFPALVYVLFVVESATTQTTLSLGQEWALVFLFVGGVGLIILGAVWTRQSAPAYLAICGLVAGTVFGLHTLGRVALGGGDEFLLGAVVTPNAPALGDEIARLSPALSGVVSVDPSFSAPFSWYTRGVATVRIEPPSRASAAVVQSVDQTAPPGFQILVASSEVVRSWYPSSIDGGGIIRWLLYRQAWQPVQTRAVRLLVLAQAP